MSKLPTISFAKVSKPKGGAVLVLVPDGVAPSTAAGVMDPNGVLDKAAQTAEFTAKKKSVLDVLAPAGSDANRLIAMGIGKPEELTANDWASLGGTARAKASSAPVLTVMLSVDGVEITAEHQAAFAQGYMLRAYAFDKYKTKTKDDDASKKAKDQKVTLMVDGLADARKAWDEAEAVAAGVSLARDLVNEPANTLGPVEFAEKASALSALGVEVEVLGEKEMKKLGMGALLGVAQGSVRPPRMAIMKWMGGKAKQKPIAFIGKGVVFDTGGISIKPAGGMEDMKGDMGGAAAVTGLMHALAARKAKANVIGIIGLVENMPDGNAQRPGDIVTSMSGQTIEVINTDAEGRLVLADALWYCKETYKPEFMINLATLTGAVLVALGQTHAGIFSNNDDLCEKLSAAGKETGEKVWRLPLGPEYDKMIDSKFADMKNTGGRYAGSITAAQFLQRYVGETPWVHIDVAGTAMSSPSSDINTSWASGYGVRLLNEMVKANYE